VREQRLEVVRIILAVAVHDDDDLRCEVLLGVRETDRDRSLMA
jgi:hypothetical protein